MVATTLLNLPDSFSTARIRPGKQGRISIIEDRENSTETAAEQRQTIAHGLSRGNRTREIFKPRRGERKILVPIFFRRFAALFHDAIHSHGSRRGLPSATTPWLKHRSMIEMRPAFRTRSLSRCRGNGGNLFCSHGRNLRRCWPEPNRRRDATGWSSRTFPRTGKTAFVHKPRPSGRRSTSRLQSFGNRACRLVVNSQWSVVRGPSSVVRHSPVQKLPRPCHLIRAQRKNGKRKFKACCRDAGVRAGFRLRECAGAASD